MEKEQYKSVHMKKYEKFYCVLKTLENNLKVSDIVISNTIKNENGEWECPNCGNKDHSKMNVTRRTCGYLGENFWNEGKTKEIKSRVLHL